jgi:hypothetical protein
MSEVETKVLSASEKKKEDWMNTKWRPMMGWVYMAVCLADFVLFPVLWSLVQAAHGGQIHTQWNPITLQGAGLFHMAMGAIIGVAAFGRTQEKLAGANNGGLSAPGGFGSASVTNSYGSASLGGNAMSTGSFGSPTASYNSTPSSFGGISTGKARPAEQQYPVL